MRIVFYEGERIYLRPIEVDDEPLLRTWINDPRNWRTLLRHTPVNKIGETKWLESLYTAESDVVFGIVVRDEDRLIGSAGLNRIDWAARSATFGILIGDCDYQNRGYGTEATRLVIAYGFGTLNLHRIGLSVFSNNPRAIRTYEKAGFVREGRLQEAHHRDGTYVDELLYGILRRDWEATRAVAEPDMAPAA